jgi:hypothetical protein
MADSTATQKPLAGVCGFFDDSHALLEAARKTKAANYGSFDTFSPFPIHGMDDAMGLKRSPIPYVIGAGLTGFAVAFGLQYWTSAVDWPLIVGGKPFNSWPAFVPVMFELTVLFGGLATFGALIFFCKLPNVKRRAVDPSITRDRFALLIDSPAEAPSAGGKPFDENEAAEFLKRTGAKEVRKIYAEGWFE